MRQKYDSPTVATAAATKSSAHQASVDMKRDLNICISVLNELKSQLLAGSDVDVTSLRSELCLPVQTDDRTVLQLAPLTQCTYCDEEWLRQGQNAYPSVTCNRTDLQSFNSESL